MVNLFGVILIRTRGSVKGGGLSAFLEKRLAEREDVRNAMGMRREAI